MAVVGSGARSPAAEYRRAVRLRRRSSAASKSGRAEGDGLGVDGVIDAAGVSATLKTAIDIVRPAGWISKVGWGPQPLGFSLDPLVQKNITLQGSFSHNWPIWERVIRLLATGMLDVEPDHRRHLAAGGVARRVRRNALGADRQSGVEAVAVCHASLAERFLAVRWRAD